jgi:hypothetical protein
MSQLNFSVKAKEPTLRPRAYNPRNSAAVRTSLLLAGLPEIPWMAVTVVAVMVAAFTVAWFV